MTPREFILKWRNNALTERASAQEHFLDLCRLLDHPTPKEADPGGEAYAFEKGAPKTGGGDGWADVWKRGFFAWEYKKKRRDLDAAMKQLADYSAALDNPPIHVACDTVKFRIETRWTNTVTRKEEFDLEDLMDDRKLALLRAVFHDPDALKPKETRASLTREAADEFQKRISDRLQERHPERREEVAHFVNQLVFCFFADSVKLLPPGQPGVWKKLLLRATEDAVQGNANIAELFRLMAFKGGQFALERIRWFNGKLFDGRPPLPLDADDFHHLLALTSVRWNLIDPTIFGTLFERFLDPDKRAQIGAHYTDPDKIMMIIEPVVLRPLRAEWAAVLAGIEAAVAKPGPAGLKKATGLRDAFLERLRSLSILDPACGSGNFLYLALQHVKDLELKAIRACEPLGLDRVRPEVSPKILKGLEINPFAAELARAVIWIGDLQWEIRNDLLRRTDPVLTDLDQIECRDALVSFAGSGGASFETPQGAAPQDEDHRDMRHPPNAPHAEERPGSRSTHGAPVEAMIEAPWPEAEFIVGNPPFLGGKKLRRDLGDAAVEALFSVYDGRVPREADLVCYWFEKAWAAMQQGRTQRAGFVTTNSIRGGANRKVLVPMADEGRIFEAWADEPWVVDGASVRVSLVCFGEDAETRLDGAVVERVNADLSGAGANVSASKHLKENAHVAFQGPVLVGEFEITGKIARSYLTEPLNPNGRPNADVIVPFLNGRDVVQDSRDFWVVDFRDRSEMEASLYQSPFERVRDVVKPQREQNNRERRRNFWWRHGDLVPKMWEQASKKRRVIFSPRVSKHRLFVWVESGVLPDSRLVTIIREDETAFGILHSSFHEHWSLKTGGWHGIGNDPQYTPTVSFETFPFPEGLTPNIPAADYAADPRAIRIAAAAQRLDELRRNWLYPADLGDWTPEIIPTAAPGEAPRKYPDRFIPKTVEAQATLKTRTLTNLYNQRPQWLADAHATLDRAVASAYGWPEDINTDQALEKLLALNLERAGQGR
jgi:hypothetical protein